MSANTSFEVDLVVEKYITVWVQAATEDEAKDKAEDEHNGTALSARRLSPEDEQKYWSAFNPPPPNK